MDRVRILSFDLEGTLVDTVFSRLVWEVGLPDLYAEERGIDHEAAVGRVMQEYSEIGRADRMVRPEVLVQTFPATNRMATTAGKVQRKHLDLP